ncbi:MAG: DUF2442 domain-containing protein [Saprospiraceae bacterium]
MFPQLLSVQPITKYQLHLHYDDGTESTMDLSYLAGRGIFKQWDENELFFNVKIDTETNALVWNETLDLDPDSLYLKIKDLTFEEYKASRQQPAHAAD